MSFCILTNDASKLTFEVQSVEAMLWVVSGRWSGHWLFEGGQSTAYRR